MFTKQISFHDLKVYLGCFELTAIREAASRSKKKIFKKTREVIPEYKIIELSRLTGLSTAIIKSSLRTLKTVALLTFELHDIRILKTPLDEAEDLLLDFAGRRSPKRPVPIPRPALRYLAKCEKKSVALTLLAYLFRGLSISRRGGVVKNAGSVKASFIANSTFQTVRSVRSARKELLTLGIITPDKASTQLKLNKTGAYFTVHTLWKPQVISPLAVDNSLGARPKISSPPMLNQAIFSPPYKDMKTSYEYKNQKTLEEPKNPPGVFKKNIKIKTPDIRNIIPEDLRSFGRVEILFFQAIKKGLIENSEAAAINFLGAAARANNVSGNPVRIFMGIIKRKLWKNISNADEERALSALRKYRLQNPCRFRLAA